jgi:hypothetical protein
MKLGAEPKKLAILVGLLLVAAVVYFINSSPSGGGGGSTPQAVTQTPAATRTAPGQPVRPAPRAAVPTRAQRTLQEFRPSLRPKRGEERPDPTSIDPTLRLDLLAKLQKVDVQGARRSIFDFGQAPAAKPDPVKVAAANGPKVPSPIAPIDAAPPKPAEQAKPQAPPVPLKFFGYISPVGQPQKRAFFVEGEEIHVVHEGDVVKRRYRIVRIGVNSVVVEDTQFKSEQTLPLEEQQG